MPATFNNSAAIPGKVLSLYPKRSIHSTLGADLSVTGSDERSSSLNALISAFEADIYRPPLQNDLYFSSATKVLAIPVWERHRKRFGAANLRNDQLYTSRIIRSFQSNGLLHRQNHIPACNPPFQIIFGIHICPVDSLYP